MAHSANRNPNDGRRPYGMSFGSQSSLSQPITQPQAQSQSHAYSQPGPTNYGQSSSSQNGAMRQQSPYKSFNDSQYSNSNNSNSMRSTFDMPQIYTAVYSGVSVYEMEVNGVACMRRRSDGWLNATQILKVAGIDKGKRTKVLEKEVLTGEHEKVQGGYGKYQGTWVNYRRGREFCRQYGVEEPLLPLLEHDLNVDGSGTSGQNTDTPTKEQAMAANRKRLYNAGLENRNNGQNNNQSTFFQNISPMSQIALSAMNKAARMNSPVRPQSNLRRQPSQPGPNQHSIQQDASFPPPSADSEYNAQGTGAASDWRQSGQEPPRKRMRQGEGPAMDVNASMTSMDPTEPDTSFLYPSQSFTDGQTERDELATDPALPAPSTPEEEEKKALLLDLFADTARVDCTLHPAFTQLSPQDLSIPLDASANTALHWATTLSRITLLRMLIQKGASIYRGNVAGHSALISAVLVNNCWERSSFPDVLELLSPLIETRDHQGRTILHHIAVSCGIKGRAPSSKYYLEALLEFLVRSVKSQQADRTAEGQDRPRSTTLMSFLTNIVNARDKLGNTALNLVARIGNRSIIQQLLEIKADPSIPNYKGVSAKDFGVGVDDAEQGVMQPRQHLPNGTGSVGANYQNQSNIDPAFEQSATLAVSTENDEATLQQQQETAAAQAAITEEQNQDMISSLTTMLTQNYAQHKTLLAQRTSEIDVLNAEIQKLSGLQKTEADAFSALQLRSKTRSDRVAKVANLRRMIEERRRLQQQQGVRPQVKKIAVGEAERHISSVFRIMEAARKMPTVKATNKDRDDAEEEDEDEQGEGEGTLRQQQQQQNLPLPNLTPEQTHLIASISPQDLKAIMTAYEVNNAQLASKSSSLQKRSNQLELLYRKVVSLCTSVPEDQVEEQLPLLVAAVESERGGLGSGREEMGRVRDFLVKVEGVGSGRAGGKEEDHDHEDEEEEEEEMEDVDEGGVDLGGRMNGGLGDLEIENTPRRMGMARMVGSMQRGLMGPPELPV